jgi:hypothetical protein
LRGFLADVLVGIRDGKVDVEEAKAISSVAAQITNSLAVEVKTALELQKMGKDQPVAGSMLIASPTSAALEEPTWCEQCEKRVTGSQAKACTDAHCRGPK